MTGSDMSENLPQASPALPVSNPAKPSWYATVEFGFVCLRRQSWVKILQCTSVTTSMMDSGTLEKLPQASPALPVSRPAGASWYAATALSLWLHFPFFLLLLSLQQLLLLLINV